MGLALKVFEPSHVLDNSGIRIGDYLEINLEYRKNKKILLGRKNIRLSSNDVSQNIGEQNISLKGAFGQNVDVLIVLTNLYVDKVISPRYKIVSQNGTLFKLNGNYTLEAFIERGDILEIFHNKIRFLSRENNFSFDKNIYEEFLEKDQLILSDLPILLEGQTGTGKTTLAKRIHEKSKREGNFIHLNISAFSNSLLESELFGHIKGAFTGANANKRGAFKEADGGTLFLDEIDSLPHEIQIKLLLFLDNQIIRPVGSDIEFHVNCRLIFASGTKLNQLVEQLRMRKDFFYRLNTGVTFSLSSLRDNPEVINHICQQFCLKNYVTLDTKLKEFYQTLPWPGNIRQLNATLKRKRVIAKSRKLTFDEYDDEFISQSSELSNINLDSVKSMDEVKKVYAKKVFEDHEFNYTIASKKLGISRKTLKRLME